SRPGRRCRACVPLSPCSTTQLYTLSLHDALPLTAKFTLLMLAISDISYGVQGKDSYTRDLMLWLEQMMGWKYDETAGVLGWATALGTAFYALYKTMSMVKAVYDVLPDSIKPTKKATTVAKKAATTVAAKKVADTLGKTA